jgi:hypothetical protein
MKKIAAVCACSFAASLCVLAPAYFAIASPAQAGQLDAAGLKGMIEGLGYEPKVLVSDPGKEKWEITVKRTDFTVPVALEISPSRNFIWLTCFLGDAPAESSSKNAAMLKRNAQIQPTMFYVSDKGSLMLGVAAENRALSAAILKRHLDKLVDDVVATSSLWNKN